MKKMMCKAIVGVVGAILLLGFFRIFYVDTKLIKSSGSSIDTQEQTENQWKDQLYEGKYTIENPDIILNPYGNAPLCALLLFTTKEDEAVTITVCGKTEDMDIRHVFQDEKHHLIPIYGLYPAYHNEIIIETGHEKKHVFIQTEKLPDDFALPSQILSSKLNTSDDLYFYTPSSKGYTFAIDKKGDVRWYLNQIAVWEINRLYNGHLLLSSDRLINLPYYMTGLYEIDLLGKIYVEYRIPGGYHHDYFELDNGNILVCSNEFNNDEGTVEDVIVEIDRTSGNIVKTIDLKDILPMESGENEDWTSYDWFHNNSVWYDKMTNLLILSGRHQDAVVALDYTSKKLKWIMGSSEKWDESYRKYLLKPIGDTFEWQWEQHAAMITPDGNLFLFDNGKNKSKYREDYVSAADSYSRGVIYHIDSDNMTVQQVWEYGKERGSEFYSPYISDVDYLAENHYIIHSGGISYKDGQILNVPAALGDADERKSITTEVKDNRVIFEVTLPANTYRVEKMNLYKNCNYTFGKGKVLGSLGKTDIDKQYHQYMLKAEQPDNEYKQREIDFTQEYDRLAVSARLFQGERIAVILKKGKLSNAYEIRGTRKPYTALCVDMFTESEKTDGIVVTKYINREGLDGKYEIYVRIDDKLYRTGKWVKF